MGRGVLGRRTSGSPADTAHEPGVQDGETASAAASLDESPTAKLLLGGAAPYAMLSEMEPEHPAGGWLVGPALGGSAAVLVVVGAALRLGDRAGNPDAFLTVQVGIGVVVLLVALLAVVVGLRGRRSAVLATVSGLLGGSSVLLVFVYIIADVAAYGS